MLSLVSVVSELRDRSKHKKCKLELYLNWLSTISLGLINNQGLDHLTMSSFKYVLEDLKF